MPALASRRRFPPLTARAAAVLLLAAAPPLARAADPTPAETALGKVPADAEFFRSALRMGETVETIGRSQVWKQLWAQPEVQELWKKAVAAFQADDGPGAAVRRFFADPANQDLPALAADALSHEVFVYAGPGVADALVLAQDIGKSARVGAVSDQIGGNPDKRATARAALKALAEKPDRLRVLDLVIGFKVSDPVKVAAQLKRVDPLLAEALKKSRLEGRSERVKVGGDEFLVLKLDGSLLPWDELALDQYEDKPGEFAPVITRLKAAKAVVSVGVRQGYLLIAVTESPDRLARFGGDGPKLVGRPELKPLAKVAGRPLTAVGYVSAALRGATATTPEDVAGWADLAKTALGKADLPEENRKAIEKDLDALARAIGRGLKKPGAATQFSVRTARGWETFAYDYTEPDPGEPRPLTLLDHLGGDPLLAVVWRSGTTVDDYRALVKWIAVFAGHIKKAAAAKSPELDEQVKKFDAEVVPLLKELSDVTEKLWIPALADGQEGFVLDAKWSSRRWHASMPEADRELPLPELGVVLGVSDPAKLRQALEGYRTVLNKMFAKARELDPTGQIPLIEIPKPRVEEKGGRTFAFYPIPAEWGLDKQFQPTGGVAGSVAALTLSRGHTERLLSAAPLQTGLAPFADLKRPLESAFYLNWAGFVEAAGPWVGYLIRTAVPEDNRPLAEKIAVKVMGVLKVFRSYGSVTYREGAATVTHSEAVFADIEPGGK